jgi:phospholipid/cholesterol/gamma-HCH transport system ATP-binding protein
VNRTARETAAPAAPSTSAAVEIRVEDLHKAFDHRPVLAGVNLEIRHGDLVAIVGGSGCGKTVLLQHVIGHLRPDRGRVLVADHESPGHPLRNLAELDEVGMTRIRIHTAVVFQRNALFSATVYENIALWLREIRRLDEEEIARRAREALDAVGFEGDESILFKHRDELSGGMAKRVAVARALAMRPVTMFYDEPTTGLDPVNASQIHELIVRTHERPLENGLRSTTVIITHDKDLLRRLRPRIVMLHDGVVFFDGPFADFEKSDSPIIRPYFELMPVLQAGMSFA